MNVNHEIKSQLAKLLATEDLVVENKQVETASFNVHTRVLTLPQWEKASSQVYDLLVGHEVGHALFTPDIEWYKDYQISPGIVNVVEDARIEKLMKRKYGGLAKCFYRGYNELHEDDFFQLEGEDINEMSLPDRINLHFKLGNFIKIDFSIEEFHFVARIDQCETFQEVLEVSKDLHDFCKSQDKKKEQEKVDNVESQGMPFNSDESSEKNQKGDSTEASNEDDGKAEGGEVKTQETQSQGDIPQENSQPQTGGGSMSSLEGHSSLDVKTDRALQESLKDLIDTDDYYKETNYIEIPKLDLDKVIVDNSDLHSRIEKEWKESHEDSVFDIVDKKFFEFKKSAQKEVNYLVKEFECKKSADAYARASTARTGILNTGVLHTYKFNEDLFKKVTVLPDGKNHGLVFILDWSGSMSRIMLDTLKQLYNLMWFCKKVQIPFEVYAFTICYPKFGGVEPLSEAKVNQFDVDGKFSLLNMFTSKVKGKVLEKQMKTMFRIAQTFGYHHYAGEDRYNIPLGLTLSGTPLHETMIALHQILPSFQKDNDVQKVQCVILTDGEGHPLTYHSEHVSHYDPTKTYLGTNNSARKNCFLRCRKTGRTYSFGEGWYGRASYTDAFLKNLRDKFPSMNFIGIRLLTSGDSYSFLSTHLDGTDLINARVEWRKTKTASIKTSGYHTYFGLSSNALSNDTEFEVKEDASKADIKRAFAKTLKSKKMNKKILSEFIELVA